MLDHWLTSAWLEEGGGGNGSESYSLAWYFAARKTSIDSFEKRGIKGMLFTIGDDGINPNITDTALNRIFGKNEYSSIESSKILEEAKRMYYVFHINLNSSSYTKERWVNIMGECNIQCDNYRDIPQIIAKKTIEMYECHLTDTTESEEINTSVTQNEEIVMGENSDKPNSDNYNNFIHNLIND